MKFNLKIGEKNFEIEILEKENGTVIKVGDKEFFFKEKTVEKIKTTKVSIPKRDLGEKKISAPISGQITEIFVKKGDFVEKGQKVLLLSAMKMENEICSDFEGRIKEIFVKKGEKVEKDQTLITIE